MRLLLGLTLCVAIFIATVNGDSFAECDGVATGSFVSSPRGCQYYIYCDGDVSFEDSCPTELMFNVVDGICDDAANVDCDAATVSTSTGTTITTSTSISSPISTSTSTVTTPINTSWSTTSGVSTTTSTTTWSTVTSPDGQIICPQPSRPEEVIYLPNPESCTDYYMCYRLYPIPMTCPNDLHFNALKGSCDWPEVANCKIIGTTTISPREVCTGQYSGYFEYPNNCRYYYRCTNGLLTIQECPVGFGWDASRKLCTTTGCSSSS